MMRNIMIAAGLCALSSTTALAQTTATDMKMTTAQCETMWKQALGSDTGDLSMDKAKPYASDFKKVDMNADGKLQSTEWMAGCNSGLIKSASTEPHSSGASGASGASTGTSGTSDRTPGGATERTPGAGNSGAAGTDAGQTPSGTSDRTPSK
jgi:hypothetical protein